MTADMVQQPKLFKVPCTHSVFAARHPPQTRNLLHGGLSCSATALPSRLLPESATPRPCRTIKCMSVLCDWSLISCWQDLSKPSCTYMMCSHSNIRGDPYGDLRGVIGRSCTVELCECISCAIARSAVRKAVTLPASTPAEMPQAVANCGVISLIYHRATARTSTPYKPLGAMELHRQPFVTLSPRKTGVPRHSFVQALIIRALVYNTCHLCRSPCEAPAHLPPSTVSRPPRGGSSLDTLWATRMPVALPDAKRVTLRMRIHIALWHIEGTVLRVLVQSACVLLQFSCGQRRRDPLYALPNVHHPPLHSRPHVRRVLSMRTTTQSSNIRLCRIVVSPLFYATCMYHHCMIALRHRLHSALVSPMRLTYLRKLVGSARLCSLKVHERTVHASNHLLPSIPYALN